jgi:dTDP-4-amino-4,6-dideoxygalactose transaminase
MRKTYLPFSRPDIGRREIDEVVDTLRSGWLTTGKKCQRFEERFADYVGAKYAVSLASGTAALFLSLIVEGVGPGDEVVTSPLTFASTANVVHHLGARPVFADIDPETCNLDPDHLARALTPRTRAVIPVHYSGQPCEMDEITALARKHGISIVEDAAHAIGAEYRGRRIGGLGNCTCFSLFPTKNMTTGEGGLITLNDEEKDRRLRRLRLHGMSKDGWKRYQKQGSWYYEIHEAGYKYNLSDIQAALGLAQLERVDELNRRRRAVAEHYTRRMAEIPGIRPLTVRSHVLSSWHIYPVWIDRDVYGLDRDRLVERLFERNIGTSVHFIPLHLQPFYQENYGTREGDFPVAEKIYHGILSLPLFPAMEETDADDVIAALKDARG